MRCNSALGANIQEEDGGIDLDHNPISKNKPEDELQRMSSMMK